MEISLRPMTLGEILDRTAQIYRQNFLLLAGISSVYAAALLVVGLAQSITQELLLEAHKTGALMWLTGVSALVLWICIFIFGGIAVAANNCAVAWIHLGQTASIRAAYSRVLPRLGRYLWLGFLKMVFAWLPFILLYFAFIALTLYLQTKGVLPATGSTQPVPQQKMAESIAFLMVMGLLMLLMAPAGIYGIFMELRYALAVPACIVENLKAHAAIKRSVRLSEYARGRIFVLMLLVTVIAVGLTLVTQIFFIVAAFKHQLQLPIWLRVLQQFIGFFTTTFVTPILATGLTLFYYDQRVRKEGFDVEWMMQTAGMAVQAPVLATEPPPLPWEAGATSPAANSPVPLQPPAIETHATMDPTGMTAPMADRAAAAPPQEAPRQPEGA